MKSKNVRSSGAGAVLAALAVVALAACASHPKPAPAPMAVETPPPAPPSQPSTGYPPSAVESQPLPGSERDFVINVGELVYFDYDRSDLRPTATSVLDAQAEWLNRYPEVQVRIEGNCDERGTEAYNLALGARRAAAVRDYLVAHGVYVSRITTISYGKARPIDPGHDEAAWQRNRNAHTAIVSGAR